MTLGVSSPETTSMSRVARCASPPVASRRFTASPPTSAIGGTSGPDERPERVEHRRERVGERDERRRLSPRHGRRLRDATARGSPGLGPGRGRGRARRRAGGRAATGSCCDAPGHDERSRRDRDRRGSAGRVRRAEEALRAPELGLARHPVGRAVVGREHRRAELERGRVAAERPARLVEVVRVDGQSRRRRVGRGGDGRGLHRSPHVGERPEQLGDRGRARRRRAPGRRAASPRC